MRFTLPAITISSQILLVEDGILKMKIEVGVIFIISLG